MALTEINMEWNVPNVNTYNNKFGLVIFSPDLSGLTQITAVVEVPTGFYTPLELAEYLETELNDFLADDLKAGFVANIVVSVDPKTLYFTLKNGTDPSGAVCDFAVPSTQITDASGNVKAYPDNANTTLYEMIGFGPFKSNPKLIDGPLVELVPTWVGSYASMLYTRYIDIVSDNLTKKQEVKDSTTQPPEQGGSNLLGRIYIGHSNLNESRFDISGVGCNIVGTRPYLLYKEFKTPKYIFWDGREFINLIDIKVYDDMGRPLYSQTDSEVITSTPAVAGNTGEFQITILASEN
jgi:hypothetical protein